MYVSIIVTWARMVLWAVALFKVCCPDAYVSRPAHAPPVSEVGALHREVRYTEKNIRHAVRLDHWAYGDDSTYDVHPILNQLSTDASTDPLAVLHAKYDAIATAEIPSPHHSRASAYAHLLSHFDNRVQNVARYLLIAMHVLAWQPSWRSINLFYCRR